MEAEPGHSCVVTTAVTIPKCCTIGYGDHYQIRATQSLIKPAKPIVEIVPLREDETNDSKEEDTRVKKQISNS